MQSIFRLPWCTDHFGGPDKIMYPGAITPAMDLTALKKLKRKRAVTPDPEATPATEAKRPRPATAVAISTAPVRISAAVPPQTKELSSSLPVVDAASKKRDSASELVQTEMASAPADAVEDKSRRLRQAIENQLNLQILTKHNELRLIDQELAKCQIALEQLRRCELKPYPGNEGFDYAVSCGTGAAIAPMPGYTRPTYAAPAGVVDGPYTRHYRRWLLPDAQFDSMPVRSSPVDDHLASRSTRHAGSRKYMSARATSPQRLSLDTHYAAPPPPPVAKKDCSAPLVLRRSTDNKLVKLVCNNCNRGNMSSIQGFLNHCRIAHKVVYESHDAAAIDCGRILDDQEIANLPTETQAMPVSKPPVRHTPSRTASVAVPTVLTPQSIHPFNKTDAIVPTSKTARPAVSIKPVTNQQAEHFATTPFTAAASLPKLSALMARRHHGGDLQQAAIEARRSDFAFDMSPATPGTPALATPISAGRSMLGGRQHAGKTHGTSRPQPASSYFPAQDNIHSPNTVDGNPGLVSDVEDDASISEEETHAPPAGIVTPFNITPGCNNDGGDHMELDNGVEHGLSHQHGVVIRRNSMLNAEAQSGKFANN